jgi:hypothetical protein
MNPDLRRWNDDRIDDLARRLDTGPSESRTALVAQNRLIVSLFASLVIAFVLTQL